MGLFLSLSLGMCLCVWGPRLVTLITHAYKCPHCQNRAASIPLLFGSKLEQWKWVNFSELHLVSLPSHVCASSPAVWENEKNVPHRQLPSLSNTALFFVLNFLSFPSVTVCIIYIGDLYWQSFFFLTERKQCQSCAQLVANDLSLLINCMFVYSLLTLKWAKKHRMKTSQHSVKHALVIKGFNRRL